MADRRDQQIEIEIVDGLLQISVGVDLLVHAVVHGSGEFEDDYPRVTSNDLFVQAIAEQLEVEEEDGTTLLHRAFDRAAVNAMEDGCEGVQFERESGDE